MKNTNSHPEHWYIVATEDNYSELEAWRQTVASSYLESFRIGHPLLSEHPKDDSYYYGGSINGLRNDSDFSHYREITLEQFRQITNSKPMSKTIQIPRTLLNEYFDAATTPQQEYLTKHFKLDGTTTDEAIRGLYDLACGGWKPKIKTNHPECFPEESKYFDFSKHANQYGCDSIVSNNVAESLGLYRNSGGTVYSEHPIQIDLPGYPFGLKGIIDNLVVNETDKTIVINDLKTTGKTVAEFAETVDYYNYWLQAAVYKKLIIGIMLV